MDVKEDRLVFLRVLNVSDDVCNLAAETVVALAKPVVDVTLLELYEENQESAVGQAREINQRVSYEPIQRTPPESLESLQELLQRSTGHLTDSETERLQELLYNYQRVLPFRQGSKHRTYGPAHD